MSEVLAEYEDGKIRRGNKNRFTIKLIFLAILIVFFGVYIGDMLFGKSSLDVLLGLQRDKEVLQKRVLNLKEENAYLQKEYFELRQLDPDSQ